MNRIAARVIERPSESVPAEWRRRVEHALVDGNLYLEATPSQVEKWRRDDDAIAEHLSSTSLSILLDAEARLAPHFGRASLQAVRSRWENVLLWAQKHHDEDRGPFEAFANALVRSKFRQFCAEEKTANLTRERRDQEERAAAVCSQDALVRYLRNWEKLLARHQIARPRWWHVPDLSPSDVRDELGVLLIEEIRSPDAFTAHERVGMEATYVFLNNARARLKKRRRIFEVVGRPQNLPEVADASPSPYTVVATRDAEEHLREAVLALPNLSARQQQYLWKFLGDVQSHGYLNVARVAASMGRNRSSAMRARDALATAAELAGLRELLID